MFQEGYDKENIVSFRGPFTISLLSYLGNYIKMIVNINNIVSIRVFRIFIEVTQNISYYSAEIKEVEKGIKSGIGWVNLKEINNHYILTTGNLIFKEHGKLLRKNCDEINLLNEEELRELKRRTRSQANIRDVGAHIGLIQTSMLSGNKLDCKIKELDNKHSFFSLSVFIDKKN